MIITIDALKIAETLTKADEVGDENSGAYQVRFDYYFEILTNAKIPEDAKPTY